MINVEGLDVIQAFIWIFRKIVIEHWAACFYAMRCQYIYMACQQGLPNITNKTWFFFQNFLVCIELLSQVWVFLVLASSTIFWLDFMFCGFWLSIKFKARPVHPNYAGCHLDPNIIWTPRKDSSICKYQILKIIISTLINFSIQSYNNVKKTSLTIKKWLELCASTCSYGNFSFILIKSPNLWSEKGKPLLLFDYFCTVRKEFLPLHCVYL